MISNGALPDGVLPCFLTHPFLDGMPLETLRRLSCFPGAFTTVHDPSDE